MNYIVKDIMKLLGVSQAAAEKICDRMDHTGIDYSECSQREFNRVAKACRDEVAS